MKTAMQDLIEVVRKRRDFIEDESYREAMQDVLLIALNLLKTENKELLDFLQDEINEFSVLGYEPSQYQLGYNSAINDIMEILKPTPKI